MTCNDSTLDKLDFQIKCWNTRKTEIERFIKEFKKVPKNLFDNKTLSVPKLIFVRENFPPELVSVLGNEFFYSKNFEEGENILEQKLLMVEDQLNKLKEDMDALQNNLEIIKSLERMKIVNEEGLEIMDIREDEKTPQKEEKKTEGEYKSHLIDINEIKSRTTLSNSTVELLKMFDSLQEDEEEDDEAEESYSDSSEGTSEEDEDRGSEGEVISVMTKNVVERESDNFEDELKNEYEFHKRRFQAKLNGRENEIYKEGLEYIKK